MMTVNAGGPFGPCRPETKMKRPIPANDPLPALTAPEREAFSAALTLDRQLCFAVHAAAHAFQRAYKPLLERLNLTYPQYLVMLLLWEQGPMGVKALGEALTLDSGTLSPLIKRLEQAGHVERRRDAADERQVTVSLTPSGAALRDEAVGVFAAIAGKTGCSAEDADGLRDRLHSLRQALEG